MKQFQDSRQRSGRSGYDNQQAISRILATPKIATTDNGGISLVNSWAQGNTLPVSVRVQVVGASRLVSLSGALSNGSNDTVAFYLPEDAKPRATKLFAIANGGTGTQPPWVRCQVDTDGGVKIKWGTASGTFDIGYLDDVMFFVDQ